MRRFALAASLGCLAAAAPASALCIYGGVDNAKTTLAREFRDSKWVVKAKLDLIDDHWANSGDSWSVYTVRVITRFKGPPARMLRVFTFRDSGGFYLSGGKDEGVDSDWLLFLDPPTQTGPRGVTNVVQVNYNCGQSRLWSKVSPADRQTLARLAAR